MPTMSRRIAQIFNSQGDNLLRNSVTTQSAVVKAVAPMSNNRASVSLLVNPNVIASLYKDLSPRGVRTRKVTVNRVPFETLALGQIKLSAEAESPAEVINEAFVARLAQLGIYEESVSVTYNEETEGHEVVFPESSQRVIPGRYPVSLAFTGLVLYGAVTQHCQFDSGTLHINAVGQPVREDGETRLDYPFSIQTDYLPGSVYEFNVPSVHTMRNATFQFVSATGNGIDLVFQRASNGDNAYRVTLHEFEDGEVVVDHEILLALGDEISITVTPTAFELVVNGEAENLNNYQALTTVFADGASMSLTGNMVSDGSEVLVLGHQFYPIG
jgi:hypothetical protein